MKSTSYYLDKDTVLLVKSVSLIENVSQGKAIEKALKAYAIDKHKSLAKLIKEASEQ